MHEINEPYNQDDADWHPHTNTASTGVVIKDNGKSTITAEKIPAELPSWQTTGYNIGDAIPIGK